MSKLIDDRYEVEDPIGNGSYGQVFLVIDKSNGSRFLFTRNYSFSLYFIINSSIPTIQKSFKTNEII